MTQKSKTAKFFCENCGAEVSRNAKVCRHCGRFFSSVRCPQCGKTGTPEEFSKGCPACGYTVESSAKNEKRLLKKEKKAPFSKRKALKNQINRFNNQTKNEKNCGLLIQLNSNAAKGKNQQIAQKQQQKLTQKHKVK